ncbi:phosphodiesterase [Roseovarius autotrophicus]|uniref:phosphodiesterase n=1 Tax=Roseovarius autotrophicus TaxID=2824121 RepID=UPI0019E28EEA|nr:phosphodiesterase [Roseovarius autotrophicus]MBE0453279.1 phosphodiesterase [Roseovarius sp.]
MQKIIVFTDIHLVPEGETIIGLDPFARFSLGFAHALDRHADAARVVLCGDLTHNAAPEEYARLRAALDGCPLPISLMLGNHDRRAPFLTAFPEAARMETGHIQHVTDLPGYRLICLDTLNEEAEDTHSGWLCGARLDWLETALRASGDRRVIVFTHHPPIETGFTGMDWIGLKNRAALIDRLRASGNVVQIVSGHVHRTIQGAAGGIPVTILKSPCHQMPMTLGYHDPSLSIDEPGAYGILLLTDAGVVVHSEDFTLPGTVARTYP